MIEARADVTDIAPAVLLAHREDKCPEKGPRSPGRSKSRDDDFLPFRCLDLEPVRGAAAGHVPAIRALRHDAFKALPPGFLEELDAERLAVTAEGDQLVARQDGAKPLFAFKQRKPA